MKFIDRLNLLFEAVAKKIIKLDKPMLYYGVKNKAAWIDSEANSQIFVDPIIWQSDPDNELSHPIFGTVREECKCNNGAIMFESYNNIISRDILEKYIDLTPSIDNKQLKVKVS